MNEGTSLNVLLITAVAIIIYIVVLDPRAHKLIVLRHGGRPHTIDALRHRSVGHQPGSHLMWHGQRATNSLRGVVLRLELDLNVIAGGGCLILVVLRWLLLVADCAAEDRVEDAALGA